MQPGADQCNGRCANAVIQRLDWSAKLGLYLHLVKKVRAHRLNLHNLRIPFNRCVHCSQVLQREQILKHVLCDEPRPEAFRP